MSALGRLLLRPLRLESAAASRRRACGPASAGASGSAGPGVAAAGDAAGDGVGR